MGDVGLTAAAGAALSLSCAIIGDIAEAERRRSEAAPVLDAMSDAELAPLVGSLSDMASAEYCLDRFEEGAARAARMCTVARVTNQGQLYPMLAPLRGIFLCFLGRLEESGGVLDGACEAGRLAGNPHALAWGLFARAMTQLQRGDLHGGDPRRGDQVPEGLTSFSASAGG